VFKVLDKEMVQRCGVVDDKSELVHQAAVGKGGEIAKEPGLLLVAKNTVNLIVVLQVGAQAIQEHRQAFMRQTACPDPPADAWPDDEPAHALIPSPKVRLAPAW
jgi:hypothetical protein